jgi:multidrug efflux system membrane fusion protein
MPPDAPDTPRTDLTRRPVGRLVSLLLIIGGIVASVLVWSELMRHPRTTDAFVRANIVGIAPHVSGNIVELNVVDNQRMKQGDLLFIVDPRPYEAALAEAEAALDLVELEIDAYRRAVVASEAMVVKAKADATYAIDHLARLEPLLVDEFVTADEVERERSKAEAAAAAVVSAEAELQRAIRLTGDEGENNVRRLEAEAVLVDAKLNIEYCYVRAPVGGYITNLNIARGTYANQGQQVFALVDDSQWYVLANFRETLLNRIEPGMEAEVWLLSCPGQPLKGTVQGVGRAIYQVVGAGNDDLADVPPTLDWVRLAQRFPVRIFIEETPDCSFHSGSTATVIIHRGTGHEQPDALVMESP